MEVRVARTDIWDLNSLIKTYSRLVHQEVELGNKVWVNISTGSKLQAAAGNLAAMAWGASSYYVVATNQGPYGDQSPSTGKEEPRPIAWGFGGRIDLPTYRMDRPSDEALNVMEKIREIGAVGENWKSKKQLLRAMGIDNMSAQMRLNRILERLMAAPPKVEQEGATRRRRIRLTEDGALTLMLLGKG
jgi:hypothetical protein